MRTITSEELRPLLDQGTVAVVDVRSAAEYETAHVPGSIRVSLDEVRAHTTAAAAALPANAVIVCRSGARAEQACQILTATSRDDLRVLAGGIVSWERDGGPVERGAERWDLERQVRFVAGALVLAGVVASFAVRPALFLAGGVGAGLAIAALTDTCTMGALLARLPYNRRASCETPHVTERFAELAEHARRS